MRPTLINVSIKKMYFGDTRGVVVRGRGGWLLLVQGHFSPGGGTSTKKS